MSDRCSLADNYLQLPECCLDEWFSKPVIESIRSEGGHQAILPGGSLLHDLELAFQGKTTNIQLELNFARSASMRSCMRGRKHSISSMVSKHVAAECKLFHLRQRENEAKRIADGAAESKLSGIADEGGYSIEQ